jgi:hypothetical protein
VLRLYPGALAIVIDAFKAGNPSRTFAKTFASIAVKKTMPAILVMGFKGPGA